MRIIDLYKAVKPCPFCGSEDIYAKFEHGYLDNSAIVFCNGCKASIKLEENDQEGFSEETVKKAVEAWNRRAERKEILRCKDCKYFEFNCIKNVNGKPVIIAHEICYKWGKGAKTSANGYCFLAERKEG